MTGLFTEIVDIIAPDSAAVGSSVSVTIQVKNIDPDYDHTVYLFANYNGSAHFIDETVIIPSGETYSFSGSFSMPNEDIAIYAFSYYPHDEQWILDDSLAKDVALAAGMIAWITPLIALALMMAMVGMMVPMIKKGFS